MRKTRCRWLVASLWILAGALGPVTAARAQAPEPRWSQGSAEPRDLGDGSVLAEYVARVPATESPEVTLRVGFVPRFDCASLIGIRFGGALAPIIEAFFDDGDDMTLGIDGKAVTMPLLVDADGMSTVLWFGGEAAPRDALERRLADGSGVRLALPNGTSLSFSLSGSRRGLAAGEAACRAHEPLPWRG